MHKPRDAYGPEGRRVGWKLPQYNTLWYILTNPLYAGAYVHGRTQTEVKIENHRKRVVKSVAVDPQHWAILFKDHHEGYIPRTVTIALFLIPSP